MHEQVIPDAGDFALTCAVTSLEGTTMLACRVATLLHGGEILLLYGPLGAGKTTFVQALCGALGVDEEVTSPTFTLANRYGGRLTVHHLDFYRIGPDDDLDDTGLEDVLDEVDAGGAILLVEWPERVRSRVVDCLELLVVPDGVGDGRHWHLRGESQIPASWQRAWREGEASC